MKKQASILATELAKVGALGIALGAALMLMYLALEPAVSRAITTEFTVSQEITGEVSFASVSSTTLTLTPAIASITGGTSTGATQVVVTTNNQPGYTMDIRFASATAMYGHTQGGEIDNYPETSTPDYDFDIPANTAGFAYSVSASRTGGVGTGDLDQTFLDNGAGTCATGSADTYGQCWLSPSTTDERIIDSATDVPTSGSTSTISFQLVVQPNPSPAIPADTYTATATLTAVVK